jgi:two-component system sensor histidine kinase KdpD
MGLGLAISRSIAMVHDGSLTAENRPGGGAIFRLRLPFLDHPPEIDPLGDPPTGGGHGT